MPELPEVETMVRGLRPALVGRIVRRVTVIDHAMLKGCDATELEHRVAGAVVRSVTRRGKWVAIDLSDRRGIIVIQPRMTGGFWLVEPPRPEHVRLTFGFDRSPEMIWFCDTRRLGRIHWHVDPEAAEAAFRRSQGPEALEIGLDDFRRRLMGTSRGIKSTLMDQKVLAGIGNIYADEILHRSSLHPERPANRLSRGEVGLLHGAIGPVLREAIEAEGSSFDAGYRTVLGLEGGFLARNAVHRRQGQPCPRCGEAIIKTRIAGLIGRPTYYCPGCQPAAAGRRSGPSGRVRSDRVS